MKRRLKELLDEAQERVITYTPAEALTLLQDERVVFVDVREALELERDGKIPGAAQPRPG
jgi:rhodanese-related sulfurtransferase